VQVGSSDVADEERVAGEDEPRLFVTAPPVGDDVRMVGRRMARSRERANDGVPELDDVTVCEPDVREVDARPDREIRLRSRRTDERRQAGEVVGLNVRLENGRDRGPDSLRLCEVRVDELRMRVEHGELRTREATEQVARTRGRLVQKRPEDHGITVGPAIPWGKTNVPIGGIVVADSTLSLVWDATRLRLLVEIGRQGSVSAAAREVGIGQPSASEHLRNLERAAGQRLVERNGRGSRLTEAGAVLAAHAAQALQTLQAGEEELERLAGLETGTIHIGASTTPGVYLLPDTLGCFRRDHPNVMVEVEIASTGEIVDRLLAGRIQLALVGETAADERIRLEPFLTDEIVGVSRPGTLKLSRGRARASELAEQTLLVRERGSSTRRVTERALGAAGVWPSRVWELDSSEAIKRAAREGLGIAFLSRYAVAEEIQRGELEHFRIAGQPPLERELHVAHLARRTISTSEHGFLETLTRCCAKSESYAADCVA
jgi:molybdate transport repressor ModE-like protein